MTIFSRVGFREVAVAAAVVEVDAAMVMVVAVQWDRICAHHEGRVAAASISVPVEELLVGHERLELLVGCARLALLVELGVDIWPYMVRSKERHAKNGTSKARMMSTSC